MSTTAEKGLVTTAEGGARDQPPEGGLALTVTQDTDRPPVPLAQCAADLLGRLDELERPVARLLAQWSAGYAAGQAAMAGEYERGFTDGLAAYKAAQHDWHAAAVTELDRWELRGQRRTRRTFARPHPDDYPGGAA